MANGRLFAPHNQNEGDIIRTFRNMIVYCPEIFKCDEILFLSFKERWKNLSLIFVDISLVDERNGK